MVKDIFYLAVRAGLFHFGPPDTPVYIAVALDTFDEIQGTTKVLDVQGSQKHEEL